jgi:hypothetical protein
MTGPGTRWELPGGHQALEVDGSTRDTLRVCVIREHWPWPQAPQTVARDLCKRMPSRYLRETAADGEDAPW